MTDVTLADAIRQLRTDLALAQEQGLNQKIRLAIKEVQVELSMVAKTGDEAGGGIKAWLIDVSAKSTRGNESGHKIILKLEARDSIGELQVSDMNCKEQE